MGQSDVRLAELLAARLCHDLASPLAAIDNGLELMTDPDFGDVAQAGELVGDSVRQAVASLNFLRAAYGSAGAMLGDPHYLQEVAESWLTRRGIALNWNIGTAGLRPELGRLLLNLLALGGESLPRGGALTLSAAQAPAAQRYGLIAEGADAGLRPEMQRGLDALLADGLDPRGSQAFFLRRLAEDLGGTIEAAREAPDRLSLDLILRS